MRYANTPSAYGTRPLGTPQSINAVEPTPSTLRSFDLLLVSVVGALLILSLVMVYSASIAITDGPTYELFRINRYFMMQLIYIALGLMGAYVVFHINMMRWEQFAPHFFVFALVLLVLVLVPFIGREVNGARRWIPLGPLNFQPSELMKMAIVIFTAYYAVRHRDRIGELSLRNGFLKGVVPIAGAVVLAVLLAYKEPDLGAAMVFMVIGVGTLFIGGLNIVYFILVSLGAFALILYGVIFTPWRLRRLLAFTDPFSSEHAQSSGYQLVHSLIAIGRGEWTGVGLGFSVEKLHYLPEAHTDFILAVIGEELGFVGIATVVVLFFLLVHRCFRIGRLAIAMDRVFSGLVAQSVGVWIGFQAFFNLSVCLGLLPTKGLTLPLVSYGGSSMLMTLSALALVLRVDHDNRQMMRGQPLDPHQPRYF